MLTQGVQTGRDGMPPLPPERRRVRPRRSCESPGASPRDLPMTRTWPGCPPEESDPYSSSRLVGTSLQTAVRTSSGVRPVRRSRPRCSRPWPTAAFGRSDSLPAARLPERSHPLPGADPSRLSPADLSRACPHRSLLRLDVNPSARRGVASTGLAAESDPQRHPPAGVQPRRPGPDEVENSPQQRAASPSTTVRIRLGRPPTGRRPSLHGE